MSLHYVTRKLKTQKLSEEEEKGEEEKEEGKKVRYVGLKWSQN